LPVFFGSAVPLKGLTTPGAGYFHVLLSTIVVSCLVVKRGVARV
jgi:hypothetical protein